MDFILDAAKGLVNVDETIVDIGDEISDFLSEVFIYELGVVVSKDDVGHAISKEGEYIGDIICFFDFFVNDLECFAKSFEGDFVAHIFDSFLRIHFLTFLFIDEESREFNIGNMGCFLDDIVHDIYASDGAFIHSEAEIGHFFSCMSVFRWYGGHNESDSV